MEQEDCDVITTLQTDGIAQLFGSEESESMTTPFQEGEDDEDMPTNHMMEHNEHSPCKTSEHKTLYTFTMFCQKETRAGEFVLN